MGGDIGVDVLDITGEQGERIGIKTRIDGLGEVDDADLSLPVEDIIGREICMYIVVGQPEFDVAHQLPEDGTHLMLWQFHMLKGRRCMLAITLVFHEDSTFGSGKGLGNSYPCLVEGLQCLELVIHPHGKLCLASKAGFVLNGTAYMPFEDHASFLVDSIVLEAAIVARAVDLGCE